MEYKFNSQFSSSANYANISFSLQKYCGWICAQPSPPPPGYCGAFAHLVSPGGGAFANFALPGGRAFANPRAIQHARGFLSEYNYTEGFTGKKADWLICQGQE